MTHPVYFLKRLPTRALSGATPHEAWTNEKPRVDYLMVFGCIAYMKIPNVHVKKLDDRSKCVVHLRRESGTKAYRLYDPETGTVHISRDEVFEEAKGWKLRSCEDSDARLSSSFVVIGIQSEDGVRDAGDQHTDTTPLTPLTPNSSQATTSSEQDDTHDGSEPPRNFRLISDIYNETEETEMTEELLLAGFDEPMSYSQAMKEDAWKVA